MGLICVCVGPEPFEAYLPLGAGTARPEADAASTFGLFQCGWCLQRGAFVVLLAKPCSTQVCINHCALPRTGSCLPPSLLLYSSFPDPAAVQPLSVFYLFVSVVPPVSYLKHPAATLGNKRRKCFVRGSLKLCLINPDPVLLSFVTSSLAGRRISTAALTIVLLNLIKCEPVIWMRPRYPLDKSRQRDHPQIRVKFPTAAKHTMTLLWRDFLCPPALPSF